MLKYSMIRLISQRSGVYIINSVIINDVVLPQEYPECWIESRLPRCIGAEDTVLQVAPPDM